ncbi:P-loop containing nucleoside triphosphate hydrolase protein [Talaromyces proteolyticus]|uniref:P-loop containing nucleoside triphosphate hydrolase protein n=1 Tax=Talaromyces proteolyticus TaxID=1131652 RepID=A0AAD4Q1D5_9EURO|nr:P-loop containing nucleoside triphosphate hydrolase protein [Talaromyces proteolyticus]KAH8702169.1 P-loop containing nucleoside triphosphate hydrolase protein [Talaromyces proteolyticus]
MASNTSQDDILSQFCYMTGTSPSEARPFLDANHWDVDAAVTEYFADQEEEFLEDMEASGGRRLGSDDPAEQSSSGRSLGQAGDASQSSKGRSGAAKKFATFRDLSSGSGRPDSGNDDDENQDLFAGGEKSGLAVQNPDDIKQKILEKAMRAQPPPSDESKSKASHFTGTARTLGGDDAPSQVIQDPNENRPQRPPRVQRTLHFWADGFSVDDGDLHRSDDPRNAGILEGIRRGRAPLSIMNVQPGQDVDVEIKQHEEKYARPKPKYKPFAGSGQRLGSPTPAIRTSQPEPAVSTPSPSEAPKPEVDESQPTVTLQIRLGDGTRLTSRFNTTHTIGDVYSFVAAASPSSRSRQWVLMTTFPNKELTDKSAVLGELSDFKRGGVVVQKWQTTNSLSVATLLSPTRRVLSGKGGVGKSSVTLQLALALSLQGKSVGILDIDLTGPSIPRLVGKEDEKITQSVRGWIPVDVHPEEPSGSENTTPRGSLRCMSVGFLLRDRGDAVIWRGPKKTAMVRQFLTDVYWGDTDYLLIDTPPGTSDEHISISESLLTMASTSSSSARAQNIPHLAGAVLVTTPQAVATSDVRKEINFCTKTQIPVLGVIENMSGYTCPCCGEVSNLFSRGGGEVMASEMSVPFLGRVPIDVKFGQLVESQKIHGDVESDVDDEMEDANGQQQDLQQGQIESDDRLLVDKYRDCWSLPIFEGFVKDLLGKIESV